MSMDPLNLRVMIWTVFTYIVAGVILFISYGGNIECSDQALQEQWKAFQRAGSAVVVIAILVGTILYNFWFLPKAREVERMTRELLANTAEYVREAMPKAKQDVIDRVTKEALEDTEKEISEAREKIFGPAARFIVIAELILVIIGTVIWGYGDLTPYLWGAC